MRVPAILILTCVLSTAYTVGAGEPQSRFFDQLRERRLFGPAERFCLEKLARDDLPRGQRIDFTYELSRTLVQHALVADDAQQDELWERSVKVVEQTLQRVGSHERTLLLQLQLGFVACAKGDALRWQFDLVPDNLVLRQEAIDSLSAGVERLVRLDAELKVKLRKPAPKDLAPEDKFSLPEIRGLIQTTAFEIGKADFETATLLASDNPDRIAAIEAAEKWLVSVMNADRHGELGQISQVLLAGCARLRIEPERAVRLLDDIEKPSALVADQITAERARILLLRKHAVEAADLLATALKNRESPPGELVGLRIQVLIDLWQTAEEKQAADLATELQTTIDQQLERVRTTNPGYWATYCETLVSHAREAEKLGPELVAQVREARGLFAASKISEALTAYTRAIATAKSTGKSDQVFDLTYTRGSIEIENKRYADAVATFDDLVRNFPANPRTPDADFLAAYALGQIYQAGPTRANREAYTARLENQRKKYPDHATYGESTWLLGQLEEKRLQNSAAIEFYQQVPFRHPRAPIAAAAAARCYDRLIQRLRELQQPTAKWESEAVEYLARLLPEMKSGEDKPLTEEQAVLALHLANIILQSAQPDFAIADRWLERVSASVQQVAAETRKAARDDAAPLPSSWREMQHAASRLRVVSLAGQGRYAEADKTLTNLAETSPVELLSIIDGLSKLIAQQQNKPQHELGELQLRAALNLKARQDRLGPEDRQRLDRCIAEAYVAAGQYDRAIDPYREQLKSRPTDESLIAGFAGLLMRFGKPARTEEAQGLWKRLEASHKPGTPVWFEARYQVARCELDLQHPDKALKLIGVTRVLFPSLGGGDMQQKFAALQATCEKQVGKTQSP